LGLVGDFAMAGGGFGRSSLARRNPLWTACQRPCHEAVAGVGDDSQSAL